MTNHASIESEYRALYRRRRRKEALAKWAIYLMLFAVGLAIIYLPRG